MKKLALSACSLLLGSTVFASGPLNPAELYNIDHNLRSDTIDVLHFHVNLNIVTTLNTPVAGFTTITATPKMNGVSTLNLDFLKMTIDSIVLNNNALTYNYNDTLLKVNLGAIYNIGDTFSVKVAYHGVPKGDVSGFGGYSVSGGYAYNLGVGFSADPHVYGRVWHPCFDNFVERATYSFAITTVASNKAICNGEYVGNTTNPDGAVTWNWQMNDAIPSYLSCIAVAPYTTVHQTFAGINGNVPVELVAVPSDTTNMKNSFVKLQNAFNTFENRFGPYRWNKVGYVLVPFNGGAMEHATNIAYPKVAVTGGTTVYEAELMSHELAHHWFGDLVTCKTAEDMWLNEGWASFASYVFTENAYGYEAYKSAIRVNHAKILQFAHIKEGGYRAVTGIPHEWTYGDHVYLKGAEMAHNIRSYMGDSLFFEAVKYYLNNNAFNNVTSNIMQTDFETSSGLNLNNCFQNWVFNPGYAHFSIDSIQVEPSVGSFDATVYVRQRLTGAPALYTNVPLEITFKNNTFQSVTDTLVMSGQTASFTFTLPFSPTYAGLNLEAKISDATVAQYKTIKTTGTHNLIDTKFNMSVSAVSDSAFIRVEHNFTAPDPIIGNTNYLLSPNRYYKVDGLFPSTFAATAQFPYDGRTAATTGNQYLDNLLFTNGLIEDSLVLLYRANTNQNWTLYPYYTKQMGNLTDKSGTIKLDSIQKGEYVLAMKNGPTGINSISNKMTVRLLPNPASQLVTIDLKDFSTTGNNIECVIFDASGKWVKNLKFNAGTSTTSISISDFKNGNYYLQFNDGIQFYTSKLVVSH